MSGFAARVARVSKESVGKGLAVLCLLVGTFACNLYDTISRTETAASEDGAELETTVAEDTGDVSDVSDADDGGRDSTVRDTRDTADPRDSAARDGDLGPDACAAFEICNGEDDDCDGVVDEGCSCSLDSQKGVCGEATVSENGECEATERRVQEETELCADGLDNDCDGKTDETTKRAGDSCTNDCECWSGRCWSGRCAHRVFVTQDTYTGDLGGLSGADQICQRTARDSNLQGTWKAVLSGPSTSAQSRLSISSGVIDLQGDEIATEGKFWTENHRNPISRTETGQWIQCSGCTHDHVWTGSNRDGTIRNEFCVDWTSASSGDDGDNGDAGDANLQWLEEVSAPKPCDMKNRLYCVDGQ